MPLISSLLPIRPTRRCSRSPSSPHQLARMPIFSAGWATIAGVHSTVWILAMRAELTSWAVPKSSSSLICGCSFFRASQIALCSRVNRVCSMPRPIHQFSLNPVIAVPVCGVQREPAVLQHQLAVGERADAPLLLLGAAVDARGVPPVRQPVDVGRRQVLVGVGPRVVPEGVGQPHRVLVPGVPVGKADLEAGLRVAVVGEPVVGLELDPGGRQQVQRRGRREGVAAHQRAADRVRVRLHEPGHRLRRPPCRGPRCGRTGSRPSPCPGRPGRCTSRRASGTCRPGAGTARG